jgi:hypothetical protein
LIRRVEQNPEQELVFRSPRLLLDGPREELRILS